MAALHAAVRAHPRFEPAARAHVAGLVAFRSRLGALNGVISNLDRQRLLEHLLYLRFLAAEEPEQGATFERLAAAGAHDRLGPRAVRSTLRLSEAAGLVVLTRSRRDGRLRICEPTPQLLALAHEYLAIFLRTFDALRPDLQAGARLAAEPDFLARVVTGVGRGRMEHGAHANVDLRGLLKLDGAPALLAAAVDRHWRGLPLPTSREFARSFHVSPSQTRAVFKAAEARGLARAMGRRGALDAARLAEAYARTHAHYVALTARYVFGLRADDFGAG